MAELELDLNKVKVFKIKKVSLLRYLRLSTKLHLHGVLKNLADSLDYFFDIGNDFKKKLA